MSARPAGPAGDPGRVAVAAFPRRVRENPYCERLYAHLEAAGVRVVPNATFDVAWLWRHRREVAVLHVHWPEFLYRSVDGRLGVRGAVGWLAALLVARALRYRIVWTVHNVLPHERRAGDRFMRWVLVKLAYLVVHDASALRTLPKARRAVSVVPHGHYVGAYPDGVTKAAARRRLGLGQLDRVFLCFGQLRAYKGLDELLAAFRTLPGRHVRLVVAGKPGERGIVRDLFRAAAADRRIRVHAEFVPDAEVQVFFRAADAVVLPYRTVTTSGAAMLAFSFGKPIVAPALGMLAALEDDDAAILYDAADAEGLQRALARALGRDLGWDGARARARALEHGWDEIARAYAGVYGLPVAPRPAEPAVAHARSGIGS